MKDERFCGSRWLLPVFFLIFSPNLRAQQGWEAGGWGGFSYYIGDLNTNFATDIKAFGLGAGLIGRYNFNERVCLKSSANYVKIRGRDSYSKNIFERRRNLWFSTGIVEWANQLEFNFMPYRHGSDDEFFTPYLFAGFSVFHFNPRAKVDGAWYNLREYGTEGQMKGEEYYGVSGALLLGGGLKLSLSYEWSLNFELTGRYTFTDYLDDVSTVYPDMDDLARLRGEIAVDLSDRSWNNVENFANPGDQRGDSTTRDVFLTAGVGILYYFGDVRCPSTAGRRKRR